MAPPSEDHQRDEQADADDRDGPARRDPVDGLQQIRQPIGAHARDLAEERGVGSLGDPSRPVVCVTNTTQTSRRDGRDQPPLATGADAARQRRRRARRPPLPARAMDRRAPGPVVGRSSSDPAASNQCAATVGPSARRVPPACAFRVRNASVVSRSRDGVDSSGERRAGAGRPHCRADERRHVLGRLQRAVVGECDEVRARERRVGGEEQRDVDHAVGERRVRERTRPASSGTNSLNLRP